MRYAKCRFSSFYNSDSPDEIHRNQITIISHHKYNISSLHENPISIRNKTAAVYITNQPYTGSEIIK